MVELQDKWSYGTLVFYSRMSPSATSGRELYERECGYCHSASDGSPVMNSLGANRTMGMRTLGSAEVQAKSDADLKRDITRGTGRMTAFKRLTAKQVEDLVAYLRTIRDRAALAAYGIESGSPHQTDKNQPTPLQDLKSEAPKKEKEP
jgi:mono/diheme cytochrome c family protein